jgi:hypothetical protein
VDIPVNPAAKGGSPLYTFGKNGDFEHVELLSLTSKVVKVSGVQSGHLNLVLLSVVPSVMFISLIFFSWFDDNSNVTQTLMGCRASPTQQSCCSE